MKVLASGSLPAKTQACYVIFTHSVIGYVTAFSDPDLASHLENKRLQSRLYA